MCIRIVLKRSCISIQAQIRIILIAKNLLQEIKTYQLQTNTFLQTEFHTKSICKKILKDPGQSLSMMNLSVASIVEKFLYSPLNDIFILCQTQKTSVLFLKLN